MKKLVTTICMAVIFFTAGLFVSSAFVKQRQQPGYILEHEKDIAIAEPGSHNGGGNSTAHKFFKAAANSKLQFTKRILHPALLLVIICRKKKRYTT